MTLSSSCGCPASGPTPTPTATPWVPKCQFTRRDPTEPEFGLKIDFSALNGGPYGLRVPVWSGDVEQILYLQPCERADCPIGYTCQSDTLSSAWLCDHSETDRKCVSYGLSNGIPFATLLDAASSSNGIGLTLLRDLGTKANLTCAPQTPRGHIEWNYNIDKSATGIGLRGTSVDVCRVLLGTPAPEPAFGNCSFAGTTSDNEVVSLNLKEFNVGQTGWRQDVTVTGAESRAAQLIYQPCGAAYCPADAFCDGDEDATVWLCSSENVIGKRCVGYGLYDRQISVEFGKPGTLASGIKVGYHGAISRYANVTWLCDRSLGTSVKIDQSVVLGNDNSLTLNVWAASACPGNWVPDLPPAVPTQTPRASPDPIAVWHNDTHCIVSNLSTPEQPVYNGNQTLTGPSSIDKVTATVSWHPWKLLPHPAGTSDSDVANLWVCWTKGGLVCHAAADVRFGHFLEAFDNPDAGATLRYGGAYEVGTDVVVACDPQSSNLGLPFTSGTIVAWGNGSRTIVNLTSGGLCPQPFSAPLLPPAPATPSPVPTPVDVKYVATFTDDNGDRVEVDLFDLAKHERTVVTERRPDGGFELDLFVLNPIEPAPAPAGYAVLDTANKASVWRCVNGSVNGSVCHSVGQAASNLKWSLVNNQADNGVDLTFGYGYAGHQATLRFVCDPNVSSTAVQFGQLAEYFPDRKIFIEARTGMVCPNARHTIAKLSPGSLFLLILVCLFVVYIPAGIAVGYIRRDVIEFPNADFWGGVIDSIVFGVVYVFTCGRREEADKHISQYQLVQNKA
jgi:hypothetical protein